MTFKRPAAEIKLVLQLLQGPKLNDVYDGATKITTMLSAAWCSSRITHGTRTV